MKPISEVLKLAPTSKIRSPLEEQIVSLMELMGEQVENNSARYKFWLGRTRHLSVEQIYLMIKEAKRAKETPHILFQYLLKKSKIK